MRHSPGHWLWLLVMVGAPVPVIAADIYSEKEIRREVISSELIVRGVITSIGSDVVPRDSLFVVKTGEQYPVTIIELQISDVIKGQWPDPTIRAVLQGGPGKGSFILEYDYNYEVGEEVVLCLHYDPRMLGGAYWIWGNSGSFVMRGDSWLVRGRRDRKVSLESVVKEADSLSPERVTLEADAVLLGRIEAVDRREFDCGFPRACTADYATVQVVESWKGPAAGQTIVVRAIRRGTNLSWYAPVPSLTAGQEFVMFLKRDSVGFFPFAGFNGFLEVHGEQLIMNGHVAYPVSRAGLLNIIREELAE